MPGKPSLQPLHGVMEEYLLSKYVQVEVENDENHLLPCLRCLCQLSMRILGWRRGRGECAPGVGRLRGGTAAAS